MRMTRYVMWWRWIHIATLTIDRDGLMGVFQPIRNYAKYDMVYDDMIYHMLCSVASWVPWRGVTWRDVTRHDMTLHGMAWHDICGMVRIAVNVFFLQYCKIAPNRRKQLKRWRIMMQLIPYKLCYIIHAFRLRGTTMIQVVRFCFSISIFISTNQYGKTSI